VRRLLGLALLVAPLLLAAVPLGAQCAMCQASLTNSPEGRGMSEEFNRAILVMLFAPYAVFGSIGAVLMRQRIRTSVRRWVRGLRRRVRASSSPRVH
jgi:hypothetical protein